MFKGAQRAVQAPKKSGKKGVESVAEWRNALWMKRSKNLLNFTMNDIHKKKMYSHVNHEWGVGKERKTSTYERAHDDEWVHVEHKSFNYASVTSWKGGKIEVNYGK